jgi:hypothetical protein
MTPVRAAAIRYADAAILLAVAVGLAAAAVIVRATAASGLALAWPLELSNCLPCQVDRLYDQFGIPGAVFGGVAAAVVTIGVGGIPTPGGALFGGGVAASPGFRDAFGRDEGDNVTTFIPGVSALPDKGDRIYVPSIGASKVTDVYYDPDSYGPDGSPGGVVVETELGSIVVTGTKLDEQ